MAVVHFGILAVLLAVASAAPADTVTSSGRPPLISFSSLFGTDFDTDSFGFPAFGNLFGPLWKLIPSFDDFGPKIIVDENSFRVSMEVKNYKPNELKVRVKNGFLIMEGTHEVTSGSQGVVASQFVQTYSLPTNASQDDVTAELSSDRWLTVKCKLAGERTHNEEKERAVPIVETNLPYSGKDKDVKGIEGSGETAPVAPAAAPAVPAAAPVGTSPASVDDRREETTQKSDQENSIIHGNEVVPL